MPLDKYLASTQIQHWKLVHKSNNNTSQDYIVMIGPGQTQIQQDPPPTRPFDGVL